MLTASVVTGRWAERRVKCDNADLGIWQSPLSPVIVQIAGCLLPWSAPDFATGIPVSFSTVLSWDLWMLDGCSGLCCLTVSLDSGSHISGRQGGSSFCNSQKGWEEFIHTIYDLRSIPRSLQTPDRPEFSTLTYQAKIPSLVPSFLAYCQQQHDPFIFPVTTT